MASRRRYQWIDAIVATEISLLGAAAPGTIVNQTLVAEAELENIGGGGTLIRIVGDVYMRVALGNPVVTFSIFLAQQFAGAVQPTDWGNDEFQRKQYLGGKMLMGLQGNENGHWSVDLRTKRKLTQGIAMDVGIQNHATAGNDARVAFHLRMLVLLP